ncbi:hypothetical protein EZV62_004067 [Acer yangbiense]|uniref:Secreted protein n=1 Tax=Acer yangbiense TaxID=1000413 RepID=A0A5C7IKK8_9ROSI|nr:hypothetical protein EZV62_004067 [Acer yangbiense]
MVSMVLCLVVGQSTADSYSKCYEDCVVDCLYTKPGKTPQGCMRLCVDQCSGSSGSTLSVHEDDTRYFCNIGRATSVCAKLAAKENPADPGKAKKCFKASVVASGSVAMATCHDLGSG